MTEFPPSIPSRPVYEGFSIRKGLAHVFFVQADGCEALREFAQRAPAQMWEHVVVFAVGSKALALPDAATIDYSDDFAQAIPKIQAYLRQAIMGTQLYVAGSEGFIGQVTGFALEAGFELSAIQTEHRGHQGRRMQCVHCKSYCEDVDQTPFVCSGCGQHLFVRDHYSRRLAAFQGVRVDAESPGDIPSSEAIYS